MKRVDVCVRGAGAVGASLALALARQGLAVALQGDAARAIVPARADVRTYALTEERLTRAKAGVVIMHPGPMNEGVEIDPRVARSAQSVIETQVTNGVAVRMALLYLLNGLPA